MGKKKSESVLHIWGQVRGGREESVRLKIFLKFGYSHNLCDPDVSYTPFPFLQAHKMVLPDFSIAVSLSAVAQQKKFKDIFRMVLIVLPIPVLVLYACPEQSK
jgi:hypothetical protein